jgi:hypothetical protein
VVRLQFVSPRHLQIKSLPVVHPQVDSAHLQREKSRKNSGGSALIVVDFPVQLVEEEKIQAAQPWGSL